MRVLALYVALMVSVFSGCEESKAPPIGRRGCSDDE